ncbi:DUF2867 domain-containing protein [Rhizobium sp. YIM 134829]|uniref:DUF2867 domain-containing protein n=1 Tax=Rhizobium sp. YIM 134829 TaxID=3390453 RepID=UPI00397E58F9
MKRHAVFVPLPHPKLPAADWADCFQTLRQGNPVTARRAAELMLTSFPLWVRLLMRLRDGAVRPFGLMGRETVEATVPARARIGFFPVIDETNSEITLGLDDHHLDFRLVVTVENQADASQLISVTTLVHRKVTFGRVYMAAIAPFHRLIVRSSLNRLA